jgi:hypothetical protein
MPLRDILKKKDKHKDVSALEPGPALPPRPPFTFLRSDTYTQDVLSLPEDSPEDPPEDPPDDPPEPLSPTDGAGGGRRQAFSQLTGLSHSRSNASNTSRSSDASKSKDKDRPHDHRRLSERLGLRKGETSANVPQDFHEIADRQYEDGNAREQRATILAKENENSQITYDHPEFSSSVAGRPAGGSSSNREDLLDLNDEQPIYHSVQEHPLNEDKPSIPYDEFVDGPRGTGRNTEPYTGGRSRAYSQTQGHPLNEDKPSIPYDEFVDIPRGTGGNTEPYTGGRNRAYSQTSGLRNYNRYADKDLPDGADIVPMSTSGELARHGMDQEQLKEKEKELAMAKKQVMDMENRVQKLQNMYDRERITIKKMEGDLVRQQIEHEEQLRTAKKQLKDMESRLQELRSIYDHKIAAITKMMEGDLVRQQIEHEEQLRSSEEQLMDNMESQLQQQQDMYNHKIAVITKKMHEDLMRQRIEHEEQLRTAMEEKEKLIAEKHGKYQELLEKTMAQARLRMALV